MEKSLIEFFKLLTYNIKILKRKSMQKIRSVQKRKSIQKKRSVQKRKSGRKSGKKVVRKSGRKSGKKSGRKSGRKSGKKSGTKKRTIQHGKGKIDWMDIDCDKGYMRNDKTGECDDIIINPRTGRGLVPHSNLVDKDRMEVDIKNGKVYNAKTGKFQGFYKNSLSGKLNKIIE